MQTAGLRPEIQFLRSVLTAHGRPFGLALVLQLAESLLLLSMPWFAAKVVQALLAGVVPGKLLLAWLGILTLGALLAFGYSMALGRATSGVGMDLGNRVYDHLQSLPIRWHQGNSRGEVLSLLVTDVWRINEFLSGVLVPLLPVLTTCVGALVLLVHLEPLVGLAVAIAVPVFSVVLKLLTREVRPLAMAQVREEAVRQGMAEQNLSTLSLIKAFTREDLESERYSRQSATVRSLELRQLRVQSVLVPMVRWLAAASVLGLLWVGTDRVAAGIMGPQDLVGLLLYGMLLTGPVSQLAGVWGQVQHARGSMQRLIAVLEEAPEPDDGVRTLESVRGEIRFEDVAFGYPGRGPLYDSLNLKIDAGETVAIVGANGAGKTTLAHLILRFADPASGRITLDGVDIRELRLNNLRGHIGLVSQHVLLLNGTVAENIGYGRLGAGRDQVEAAARAAHAHDFISRLPQGYETRIGDEGLRLSGGQRQRISLARALLKDPAVLILDEATAMFDPEGERGFIAECHDLLHERTVILITHRPASLALADRILRMEHGELREVPKPIPAPV